MGHKLRTRIEFKIDHIIPISNESQNRTGGILIPAVNTLRRHQPEVQQIGRFCETYSKTDTHFLRGLAYFKCHHVPAISRTDRIVVNSPARQA
ncbi:hypothetical protein ES705_47785 [subsurface metagenome]